MIEKQALLAFAKYLAGRYKVRKKYDKVMHNLEVAVASIKEDNKHLPTILNQFRKLKVTIATTIVAPENKSVQNQKWRIEIYELFKAPYEKGGLGFMLPKMPRRRKYDEANVEAILMKLKERNLADAQEACIQFLLKFGITIKEHVVSKE